MTVEYDIMLIVSYSITIHWLTLYIELAVSCLNVVQHCHHYVQYILHTIHIKICYHTSYTQNIVVGIVIYYVVSNSSSIYGKVKSEVILIVYSLRLHHHYIMATS